MEWINAEFESNVDKDEEAEYQRNDNKFTSASK